MIKILVDSASDITQKEAEEMGIYMVPIEVRFGEDVFFDGVNLSKKEFYEKLIESSELPKTSQINEFRFEEEFKKLTQNGDELIVITISSKLSGTFDNAKRAAKEFGEKVAVVDSLNAAIGERILCEFALKLISEGKSLEEIVKILNEKKKNIQVIALLDTLKYLKKGGRISAVVALTGEIFSIKPVVAVIDGEVKLVGKAIGSKKGNNLLMQLAEKSGGIDFSMPYGLIYSGLSDEILQKYIKDSESLWKDNVKDVTKIPIHMLGSTIGTHIGPGAIGVAFYSLGKDIEK